VYFRQGNEFADQRSVATVGFAAEGVVRRVMVILHEDLHGDNNFDLPWEIEESVVTPLGSLATVEFFRQKGDEENLKRAVAAVEVQRKYSRELNALAEEAERILQREAPENAKKQILELIPNYPTYHRQFQRQIAGQHPPTVLEAKLSHDLAYYKYFDWIASLSEKTADLKTLISDLKKLPHDASHGDLEGYLRRLDAQYGTQKSSSGRMEKVRGFQYAAPHRSNVPNRNEREAKSKGKTLCAMPLRFATRNSCQALFEPIPWPAA